MRKPVRARSLFFFLAVLLALAPGCSMFYRHEYKAERFAIYSDLSPQFLHRIGPEVEEIYRGYQELLGVPPQSLGRTTIILRGDARDQEVVDLAYSPDLLGYYIPFLKLISVDTKPAWTRERPMLRQILLHEIAHHFIVTAFPAASKECWLNEGLAGNLEVTLFEDGRFEYPLLNPALMGIVRHAILTEPETGDLKRLVSLGWREFHGEANKELDYALAWALVYYLLEHYLPPEMPLGERIHALCRLERSEITSLEPRWKEFLRRFDLTGELIRMARASAESPLGKLTPRWAVRQLGNLKFLEEARVAPALVDLLEAPDLVLRTHSSLAFLKMLGREPAHPAWSADALRRGREKIAAHLVDRAQPVVLRELLTGALGDLLPSDSSWAPLLIELLESPEGELRAAAAHGLSLSAMKPTIVNPAFWRDGEVAARADEVNEWRAWWASHQESPEEP